MQRDEELGLLYTYFTCDALHRRCFKIAVIDSFLVFIIHVVGSALGESAN